MRAMYVSIPVGLLLAVAGVGLMIEANQPHSIEMELKEAKVRHLVTDDMMREAASETMRFAPTMTAKDSDHHEIVLGSRAAKRPQFVYFVLDRCPCSFDAEPLFHKLFDRYKGKIDFVSVTDGDLEKAHDWSVQMLVNYPVIPDPSKRIIHAFGAKSSVYSELISPSGHILRMWPGYSADILKEMNKLMAESAGVTERAFDPEYAPKTKATGCSF